MISRRELFTWWRRPTAEAMAPASSAPSPRTREPMVARVVEPTWVEDAEPFSLESFYAARKGDSR